MLRPVHQPSPCVPTAPCELTSLIRAATAAAVGSMMKPLEHGAHLLLSRHCLALFTSGNLHLLVRCARRVTACSNLTRYPHARPFCLLQYLTGTCLLPVCSCDRSPPRRGRSVSRSPPRSLTPDEDLPRRRGSSLSRSRSRSRSVSR